MSEDEILSGIESLDEQIILQQSFLSDLKFENERQPLQATIQRLIGARYRLAKLLSSSLVIKSVAEDATDDEIDEHRQGQPVQCGPKVYLPIPISESFIILPSCLLRSAVFGTSNGGEPLDSQRIGSHANYIMNMSGSQLNAYDRRVFAACLEHYQQPASLRRLSGRAPQALASDLEDEWIKTTYWKLAPSIGRSFGPNVGKAIQASLVRLSSARLDVSWGEERLVGLTLVEVRSGDHGGVTSTSAPRAGDIVEFRIVDRLAKLYLMGGPKASTIIDKAGLKDNTQALASWLACYYSSHRRPFATSIGNLRAYCGAAGKPYEFKHQLKNVLTKFQSPETPKQFRVSRFELTKTEVTVHLARWKS